MKIQKQSLIYSAILILSGIFNSCMDDVPPRTLADELTEINYCLQELIADDYDIDTTESGVYYIVMDTGTGPFPAQGDTVSVGYAGYFLDGSMFDTSEGKLENDVLVFRYLDDPMIQGFEDGLALMNKGARIEMIIPSSLAYGATGQGTIPAYTPLIFVAKMVDLKPKSAQN